MGERMQQWSSVFVLPPVFVRRAATAQDGKKRKGKDSIAPRVIEQNGISLRRTVLFCLVFLVLSCFVLFCVPTRMSLATQFRGRFVRCCLGLSVFVPQSLAFIHHLPSLIDILLYISLLHENML